jgi:LysR family glycine cleavage system transcriptional activator
MPDHLVLLAAPSLLGKKPPSKLEQVLRLAQLQASEDWSAWLATMPDAPLQLQRPPARLEFTDSTHMLEAARAGLGVALTRRSIADALMNKGELQSAHPHRCAHSSAYYALVPAGARPLEVTEQFLAWLQVECARYAKAL